jgi:uncharacterized protein YqcC (DUF446 family)
MPHDALPPPTRTALVADLRTYRHEFPRVCAHCQVSFRAWNKAQRYCGKRCRTDAETARRNRSAAGKWLREPKICPICNASFFCTKETGPNKVYCSPACTIEARARYHHWWKSSNPKAMTAYNRERTKRYGHDTLINRLHKRYQDLATACEARGCGESRVLEVAHKPEFKRNGAHRTLDKYERHMFWVLCPTCHRVLDREIETPEQMGLGDTPNAI